MKPGYPQCHPMPIVQYAYMISRAYPRHMILKLCRWKLRDNYTYSGFPGYES